MKRSYLEKVYFKKKTPDSLRKSKNHSLISKELLQQNLQKERKKYFKSLNPRIISDNKSFWKNTQPFSLKNVRLAKR